MGVYVAVDGQYADPAVRAAFDGIKQVANGVDKNVFEAAKNSAQLEALLRFEQSNELALEQAHHVLAKGEFLLPTEVVKQIGQVTEDDVKKVGRPFNKSRINYLTSVRTEDCLEAIAFGLWTHQPSSLCRSVLGSIQNRSPAIVGP